MCQPPTKQIAMAVSKAINEPDASIRYLRPVRSSKLHRVYEVVLSDGRILELVMPPPSMLRLLRSERQIVNAEALVVQWLSTLLSEESRSVEPGLTQEDGGRPSSSDRSSRATSRSSGTSSQQPSAEKGFPDNKNSALLRLLPRLVNSSVTSAESGAPHSLYQLRGGTPIASLPRPLTKQERAEIDIQLGRLTRQFAKIKSPTGRFGLAVSILASSKPITGQKDGSRTSSPSSRGPVEGSHTWAEAFHVMFEGVLRDSEDMAIMLAYPIIRKHLARLSYLLDEVTTPSLVFLDGMDDDNVLVDISAAEQRKDKANKNGASGDSDSDGVSSDEDEAEDKKASSSARDRRSQSQTPLDSSVCIVGLRDWSNGIFGDALLATAFSNSPSKELLDGYHGTCTNKQLPTPPPNSDEQNASVTTRLLLYQAYHATVSIVTEFYRPRGEGTTRELAARRRLTEVLMKLEGVVDDDPKGSRHRRPSGELSPAKKLKPDEKEKSSPSRRHETTIQEV
ncbi:hypothetical protein GE09DRAFT_249739 [Coniochaeta sp. 2T2.1]|nr:hypothetical protein GE09DRAFT_249739 [Coniochaeta sp. 2T2.1]